MTASQPAHSADEPGETGPSEDTDPAEVLLAEPGQRLLARIVDTLIVGLPVIVVVRELVTGHRVDLVAPPAVAGCFFLYEVIQLALWGRTLGKRFAGIQVVSGSGAAPAPGRLDVSRALLRAVVYALPIAARPVPVLGLLAGIFWVADAGLLYEGERRQTLHDRLARTLVVKRPPDASAAL